MRLIRKFFKSIYKKIQSYRQTKAKKLKKVKYFETQIEEVVTSLLDNVSNHIWNRYSKNQMLETIGRIINNLLYSKLPKSFKSDDTENIKAFAKKFTESCTKYTHFNFNQVLQMKYFKVVLDIFVECEGEKFIRENSKNGKSINLICENLHKIIQEINEKEAF